MRRDKRSKCPFEGILTRNKKYLPLFQERIRIFSLYQQKKGHVSFHPYLFCEGIKGVSVPSKRVFFLMCKKKYLLSFQEGIRIVPLFSGYASFRDRYRIPFFGIRARVADTPYPFGVWGMGYPKVGTSILSKEHNILYFLARKIFEGTLTFFIFSQNKGYQVVSLPLHFVSLIFLGVGTKKKYVSFFETKSVIFSCA